MQAYEPIPIAAIEAARARIAGAAIRTPLVRLNVEDAPAEIYLKLENLQPIGSFKLRGASNAILSAGRERLAEGVWTASAGNMAQGAAWAARQLGVPCRVVVPETAPATKLDAIRRLGGDYVKAPVADWLAVFHTRTFPGMTGIFVHPFNDPAVMAGNATIGVEILEDLPDVDTIVVPWGGGGLCCGIASAIHALAPDRKVYAGEVESGAPLIASLAAGAPTEVTYTPSFVDGIGAPFVVREMFDLAQRLLAGSLVTTREAAARAIQLLIERNRIVAEGAAAVPLATALAGQAGGGKIVCVVSGGNIDSAKLATILSGGVP